MYTDRAAGLLLPMAQLDSASAGRTVCALCDHRCAAADRQFRQGWLHPEGPAHPHRGPVRHFGRADFDLANYTTHRAFYETHPAETHHQVS